MHDYEPIFVTELCAESAARMHLGLLQGRTVRIDLNAVAARALVALFGQAPVRLEEAEAARLLKGRVGRALGGPLLYALARRYDVSGQAKGSVYQILMLPPQAQVAQPLPRMARRDAG